MIAQSCFIATTDDPIAAAENTLGPACHLSIGSCILTYPFATAIQHHKHDKHSFALSLSFVSHLSALYLGLQKGDKQDAFILQSRNAHSRIHSAMCLNTARRA